MRMNKTKFLQTDSKWGGLGYPKKPWCIRNCGCGEVSIANCIIEMEKYAKYDPATIQPYCKQYAAPNGDGTYWSGIPAMMKHYGMTEVKEHATMNELWKELAKGDRVAIYLMGSRPGGSKGVHWTSSGHFICSVGYKYEDGLHKVYVKDSYSNSPFRNKWITYEGNMRYDVLKVWSGKISNEKPAKTPKPSTTSTAKVTRYKVIDVSVWQGYIDWKKVKADGVTGAIIRYADGDTLDSRFKENMQSAKAAGLHIGSYIFSRAKTKAQAEKEATRLYKACKPYAPDMPLYIDLEASGLEKYADKVASAFLDKMKELGGKGGVYANLNWWDNYLTKTVKDYSSSAFWIAQYNDKITYKKPGIFGMWQYSSSGKVKGIRGCVDMDWCYKEYWKNAPKTDPPPKSKEVKLGQACADYDHKAGDSSGKEVTKTAFKYSTSSTSPFNWTYVFRPKDSKKAEKAASMCEKAIANNCIGYNSHGETAYGKDRAMTKLAKAVNYDLSKITTKCGLSCGDLICLCNRYAGLSTCYIGSGLQLANKLKKNKNFECLPYKKGMDLRRGDTIITAHSNGKNNHVAMVL